VDHIERDKVAVAFHTLEPPAAARTADDELGGAGERAGLVPQSDSERATPTTCLAVCRSRRPPAGRICGATAARTAEGIVSAPTAKRRVAPDAGIGPRRGRRFLVRQSPFRARFPWRQGAHAGRRGWRALRRRLSPCGERWKSVDQSGRLSRAPISAITRLRFAWLRLPPTRSCLCTPFAPGARGGAAGRRSRQPGGGRATPSQPRDRDSGRGRVSRLQELSIAASQLTQELLAETRRRSKAPG
jgi:hypothetical protein